MMGWVIDKLLTFTGYAALAVVILLMAGIGWLRYMNTAGSAVTGSWSPLTTVRLSLCRRRAWR